MITTFYSYKPNIGCTTAAVKIAILLCEEFRKKVLLVDWNFATPKLLAWLESVSQPPVTSFIALLDEYMALIEGEQPISADHLPKCQEFVNPTAIPGLDFLPASGESVIGDNRLASFNWSEFYHDYHGGAIVEHLIDQWTQIYDVVIVISEKGVSNVASVCMLQVPDVVVVMISMNVQEIEASRQVARMLHTRGLKRDGKQVRILPVPSKFPGSDMRLAIEFGKR